MKKFTYILICIVFLPAFRSAAQRSTGKGDKYFFQNQFVQAIPYYQADSKARNKKVAEYAMLRLADCYRILGEFEKAEETYRKILKKSKKNPLSYLNYGLSLKSSAKYAEAKVQLEEYIKMNAVDPMGPVYLQSCDSAQKWLDETMGKEVKNITKINTDKSEFGVYLLKNRLYFSSSAHSKKAFISFDGGGEIDRMDIYSIALDALLKKETVKNEIVHLPNINTPAHEGTPAFSADGKEMYFSKTVKGKRKEGSNDILSTLQVFYTKQDSLGNWSKPVSAFSFNSNAYSVAHPSLTPGGDTIYFMSDMPGGFGKTDIYYTAKGSNGNWSKPVNLGSKVNTFGHELFPYITSDGTLYFSSDAHPGMGQLDIFSAKRTNKAWDQVQNLKPPYNSIGNDFGICFDATNTHGFFGSDRFNGTGAEDIYSFSLDAPAVIDLVNDTLRIENGYVFDEIKFRWLNTQDSSKTSLPVEDVILSVPLKKNVPCVLTATKNGMALNNTEIVLVNDSLKKSYYYTLRPELLPIKVKGRFPHREGVSWADITVSLISDNGVRETITAKEDGSFRADLVLLPGVTYKLVPSIPGFNVYMEEQK